MQHTHKFPAGLAANLLPTGGNERNKVESKATVTGIAALVATIITAILEIAKYFMRN